ncbi:MAG: glycosyltransferase family 2 protein [Lachnospiraceae bacterium]
MNREKQPEVSVVIPAYNGAAFLAQAVESVYAQGVAVEVIVVDDASEDSTAAVAASFAEREGVIYIRNEQNLGVAASRNKGVQLAQAPYVAFLDADDWWGSGKLAHQIQLLEESQKVLCSTGRELMNEDGSSTGKRIGVKPVITYKELLKHNSINCSSVLIRTDVMRQFPMQHEDSHEDYITWLRILRQHEPAVAINEPYLKYRLSQGGKSRNKVKSAQMTYRVYRYMGYSVPRCLCMLVSYMVHGVVKYL